MASLETWNYKRRVPRSEKGLTCSVTLDPATDPLVGTTHSNPTTPSIIVV